jgi:hypothetical protein
MAKTQMVTVSNEQYRGLQCPVALPKPNELLDFEIEQLTPKGLATYAQVDSFRKDLPSGLFLFVPPWPEEMDLNHLVSLIEVDGKPGVNYLDEQCLVDEIKVPPPPYIAEYVEDGANRLNTRLSVSRTNILPEHRSPGLTYEGIVHCIIFPEVLKHHSIDLVGSRYETEYRPGLYLLGSVPGLNAFWVDLADPEWGAWSCGSRRGV